MRMRRLPNRQAGRQAEGGLEKQQPTMKAMRQLGDAHKKAVEVGGHIVLLAEMLSSFLIALQQYLLRVIAPNSVSSCSRMRV